MQQEPVVFISEVEPALTLQSLVKACLGLWRLPDFSMQKIDF